MRNALPRFIVTALIALAAAVPAFALWGTFPNDEPVKADLPQTILKAVNRHKRIWGEAGPDTGWQFCFRGDTKAVNEFLAAIADEKTASLRVVLVPEPGSDTPDPFKKDFKINYEWALWVYRTADVVRPEPIANESDDAFEKRRAAELAKLPKYGVAVTVYCAGPIDVDAVKIPLTFEASVGGRMAELVEFHNRRRDDLQAKGKPLTGKAPTDRAAVEATYGRFGEPTTRPSDDAHR